MRLSSVFVCLLMASFWVPVPVFAQTGDALVDAIGQCRKLPDDHARLACYDRAATDLSAARERDGLVVLSRAEVKEKRRSLFGLKLPDINIFGRNEAKEPQISEITSTVSTAKKSGRGQFIFRLADNSTWQTTEPPKFDPEAGDKVVVRRGALGSFRASFAGAFPVRVERIE